VTCITAQGSLDTSAGPSSSSPRQIPVGTQIRKLEAQGYSRRGSPARGRGQSGICSAPAQGVHCISLALLESSIRCQPIYFSIDSLLNPKTQKYCGLKHSSGISGREIRQSKLRTASQEVHDYYRQCRVDVPCIRLQLILHSYQELAYGTPAMTPPCAPPPLGQGPSQEWTPAWGRAARRSRGGRGRKPSPLTGWGLVRRGPGKGRGGVGGAWIRGWRWCWQGPGASSWASWRGATGGWLGKLKVSRRRPWGGAREGGEEEGAVQPPRALRPH